MCAHTQPPLPPVTLRLALSYLSPDLFEMLRTVPTAQDLQRPLKKTTQAPHTTTPHAASAASAAPAASSPTSPAATPKADPPDGTPLRAQALVCGRFHTMAVLDTAQAQAAVASGAAGGTVARLLTCVRPPRCRL